MQTQTILIAIITFLLGGMGGYVAGQNNTTYGPFSSHMDNWNGEASRMYGNARPYDMPHMNGMNMMAMTVESEREFIMHMIPHHQEAIDTAQEVLERGGTTPEVRALMESIIEAQTTEVAMMQEWYENWYGEPYTDDGNYTPMMRELAELSGTALDRAFLEDMIMHHMGAIMMARSVQPYIEHEEIAELTKNIVSTQSSEIVLMRDLLQTF